MCLCLILQAPETPSPILHKRPRNDASLRDSAPPVKQRHLDLIRKSSPDDVHGGSSSDESVGEGRAVGDSFPSTVEMQSLSSENSQNSSNNSKVISFSE